MKRLLFVDDEPNVLDGLRRLLRPHRASWDMVFVSSGEEALAELGRAPFDVVLSDMRMPGMDGAALLARVQQSFPGVVRLVLSGHADMATALHAVPVAHQFLSKPCDPAVLEETVERALGIQALLADPVIRTAVAELHGLPSLPRVYSALTRAMADPGVSLEELARVVEQDIGLSARVLQVVSSGFFGRARRVTGVGAAVGALGTSLLKSLVLSAEVVQVFADAARLPGFSLEEIHRRALLGAAIAGRLVPEKAVGEQAITAALLRDVGQLVLASRLPDQFQHVLAAAHERGVPVHVIEAEIGPTTHAEVGAYLLGLWGLPYGIVEAVAHHHAPWRVTRRFDLTATVYVADHLVREQASGEPQTDALDVGYLETLGVAAQLPAWRALAASELSAVAAA